MQAIKQMLVKMYIYGHRKKKFQDRVLGNQSGTCLFLRVMDSKCPHMSGPPLVTQGTAGRGRKVKAAPASLELAF